MKRILPALCCILVLNSCRKESSLFAEQRLQPEATQQPQSCDFGMIQFNTIKRPPVPEGTLQPDLQENVSAPAVLLLDVDGHTVTGTSWNYAGPLVCAPANLTAAGIEEIVRRVSEDFAPFEVAVTTSESAYNQCNPYRRMRVIITESWEWFGLAGGTAFLGSFGWGNNTPCFVFSVLLNYDSKKIGEAVSHEIGHTFGLYHQPLVNPLCTLLNEYHPGAGTGQLAWAPIMGLGYYRNMTTWHRALNCSGQDDLGIIESYLVRKPDDHPNIFGNPTPVGSLATGCINGSGDVDFFVADLTVPATLLLEPANVGAGNDGANCDLQMKLYSRTRSLIGIINDPQALSVSIFLEPGRYFIGVESVENGNAARYGQLGNYTLRVQP